MRLRFASALVAGLVALTLPVAGPATAEQEAAAASFVVAEPSVRVLDTRDGTGAPAAAVPTRGTITVDRVGVTARCGAGRSARPAAARCAPHRAAAWRG